MYHYLWIENTELQRNRHKPYTLGKRFDFLQSPTLSTLSKNEKCYIENTQLHKNI
jgi:hypothetical protein